jgi:hypothetical protein
MASSRLVTKISSISIMLLAGVSIMLFQNCSPSGGDKSNPGPVTDVAKNGVPYGGAGGGNGYGYGGKPYIHLLASGLCADGSNIEAQINQNDATFFLLRESCANLAAPKVVSVILGTLTSTIVYNGLSFVASVTALPTPSPTPAPTQAVMTATVFANDSGSITLGGGCPTVASNLNGQSHSRINCTCDGSWTANGLVYGSDPYQNDSSICRAALHAGVITASGGAITFYLTPAASSFLGSLKNGVQTMSAGSAAKSFSFN